MQYDMNSNHIARCCANPVADQKQTLSICVWFSESASLQQDKINEMLKYKS